MVFYLVIAFIFGSAIGSFLNVVIDRTTSGESLTKPMRSYCDHCKATLGTVDLIPIFSFVGLGAKCRYCKKPISLQYPMVETATAVLFSVSFWTLLSAGNLSWVNLLYFAVLVSVCVVIAVVDFKFSLIPTSFVYAASLIALVYNYFYLPPGAFVEHILAAFGASAFFLLIVVVTRGRGMGQGDIVLAFLMGIVLGIMPTVAAMFLAFFTGAVISIALVVLGKKKFGNTVPFAPFLIFGFLCALFWGQSLLDWYFKVLY